MKNLLLNLCACDGVSGNENNIADYCKDLFSQFGQVEKDYNNNVLVTLGNKNASKTLLLDAHIDQIGFIVTNINEKGFLKLDKCGGVDLRVALGSPVTVIGREKLQGIICCMPPHLSDGKEDEAPEIDKIWVDLGLPYNKVDDLVSVGDTVICNFKPVELLNNRISCCGLDNRVSVAVLYRVCQLISNKNIDFKINVLLSCQEETYGTGAITKSFDISPDECICVDVSFANQAGINDQYSNISLGKGPMICVASTLSKDLTFTLKTIANKKCISTQTEVCGGLTGTNADKIAVSKKGVKTAVISVPQKNMHTQVEIIDLTDVENTAKLIAEYIILGGVFNE